MKHLTFAIVLTAILVACSVTSSPTACPDGSQCFSLNCTEVDWDECQTAKGKVCPYGYYEISNKYERQFLIQCRAKTAPSF